MTDVVGRIAADGVTLAQVLEGRFASVDHHDLGRETALWGREVTDERFFVAYAN